MLLSENLKKSNIIIKSKSKTRWELIEEMVELAVKNKEFAEEDRPAILKSLIEREKSISTGIGNGVAIPHCSTARVNDIVLIMAISEKGIDFNAIDSLPVKIVILLLVPKSKLTQHIKTLANIAKIMGNVELRNEIISIKSAEAIIKGIKTFEDSKTK